MKVSVLRLRNINWYELLFELPEHLTLTKRLSEVDIKMIRDHLKMAMKNEGIYHLKVELQRDVFLTKKLEGPCLVELYLSIVDSLAFDNEG